MLGSRGKDGNIPIFGGWMSGFGLISNGTGLIRTYG